MISHDPVAFLEELLDTGKLEDQALAISQFLRDHKGEKGLLSLLEGRSQRSADQVLLSLFMIQLHTWRKDHVLAEQANHSLLRRAGVDMGVIGSEISRRYKGVWKIESQFVPYPDSLQNFGFIQHVAHLKDSIQTFLTKITTHSLFGNELTFYSKVLNYQPQLNAIAPVFVHCYSSSSIDLSLLTLEKCKGNAPNIADLSATRLDRLIADYKMITQVDVRSIKDHLVSKFEIGFNHGYLVPAMSQIHDPARSAVLLNWLGQAIQAKGYKEDVKKAVLHLIERLNSDGAFRRIVPEQHFSFLHGDFHRFNILQNDDRFIFIDWSHCTSGPSYIDLAVLLRRYGFSATIGIMERNAIWNGLSITNKMLFAFALILVSVMIDIDPIKNEPSDHLFLPAVDHIIGSLQP